MSKTKIQPRLTNLTWPEDTELISLEFELEALKTTYLLPDYTKGFHAWFLKQIQLQDPDLSRILHDEQQEKAFTISRLLGDLSLRNKQIEVTSGKRYFWEISALSNPVVKWLEKWLTNCPNLIELYQLCFAIKNVKISSHPTTYQQLILENKQKNFTLSFISPTSFRRKGHHFPLPVPYNLFHSYLRRWNNFSGQSFDQGEFLNWIDEFVVIKRHQIETVKVAGGKRGQVTGFTGAIELSLTSDGIKGNPEYHQLYTALGKLAPYCGTGHKTTFGLGQTRKGWLVESPISPILSVETQLVSRQEEIAQILLSEQKRPNGERAKKICETRAIIFARREFGESLQTIAHDLEMPYETVRTYAKLVRRILRARESEIIFNQSDEYNH